LNTTLVCACAHASAITDAISHLRMNHPPCHASDYGTFFPKEDTDGLQDAEEGRQEASSEEEVASPVALPFRE
jgi:hypothetical protein